jgi:hypothetical protein
MGLSFAPGLLQHFCSVRLLMSFDVDASCVSLKDFFLVLG